MLAIQSPYAPWIHYAGSEKRVPWEIVQRVLPYYLLVVNHEGAEDLVVGGQRIDIPPKGAYLIQPGVLAERIGSKKGSRPSYVHFDVVYNERRTEHRNSISFDNLEGREHLLQPAAKAVWGVDLPIRVPKALEPMFLRAIDPIVQRWSTGYPHDQLVANHDLQGLLHAWVLHETPRNAGTNFGMNPETRVRRAEINARMSLSRPFGVDDFALAAGLGRAQFTRIYRELRGVSPGRALRDMRLNEAERLLRNTGLAVQEIGKQNRLSQCNGVRPLFSRTTRHNPSGMARQVTLSLQKSVIPGKTAEIFLAFFQKGIAAFGRFFGHVRKACGFARKQLLAH